MTGEPEKVRKPAKTYSVGRLTKVQDALILDSILKDVSDITHEHKSLAKAMKFRVMQKGQNERARLDKLLSFNGPEADLWQLLEDYHQIWLNNPSCFWVRPLPPSLGGYCPETQIVGFYLQIEFDDA